MAHRTTWPLAIALIIALSAIETSAQQGGGYTLRTYEVGDLVISIQDRPYSPDSPLKAPPPQHDLGDGAGGFGGGAFSISTRGSIPARFTSRGGARSVAGPSHNAISLDDLIQAIVTTIEPHSWDTPNGEGVVSSVGTALVIRQTPAAHAQIDGLLSALRSGSAQRRTLTIDARWLLLTSDELRRLAPRGGAAQIDRDALAALTRRASSIRAITNCFSGQLVHVISGTRRNTVDSHIPVVGSVAPPTGVESFVSHRRRVPVRFASEHTTAAVGSPRVGYQPIIGVSNQGALLEIRPTHFPGNDAVVIDLASTVTAPGADGPAMRVAPGAPPIDRVAVEKQQLALTMRVPRGKPVLVGGMTFSPAAGVPATEEEEQPQLYLVLEVR